MGRFNTTSLILSVTLARLWPGSSIGWTRPALAEWCGSSVSTHYPGGDFHPL